MHILDPRDVARCVRCGLCLSACPTFRLSGMEGYSPRGRIALAAGAGGRSPDADEFWDTCLGCRSCEDVCPSGVPYGRILEGVRASQGPSGSPGRRAVEWVLLWLVARRWRLSLATLPIWLAQRLGLLTLAARLARRGALPRWMAGVAGLPRLRLQSLAARLPTNFVPPEGTEERGQVVLFAGCVQDAWARDVHWATINVLTRLGYRVRAPHGVVCCGALHAHAGRSRWARRLAGRNLAPLGQFGGTIVVNAAGCGAKLKEYEDGVAERVRDVMEFLTPDDVRRLDPRPPVGYQRVGYHDPCHLAYAQGVTEQPRRLLEAAGYEVVELAGSPRCCGAAGTYSVQHPDWAEPLRQAAIEAIAAAEPDVVAVGNPGCSMWLAGHPDAPQLLHPVQLLALAAAR